jgi:hypothetical protein
MKAFLVLGVLFSVSFIGADSISSENSAAIADILHKLASSNQNKNLPVDDDDDIDDETFARAMTRAVVSDLLDDGEDEEDSIVAVMSKSNEKEARAQFGFLGGLVTRFVGRLVRKRYCRG